MVKKSQLIKHTDYLWEIPKETRPDMKVPAHIYALEPLLDAIIQDKSLEQLINVATLPGITKAAIVMPDAHEGYGFPIGGVAATEWPDGVISPGGIGYDINCGVRLLKSSLTFEKVKDHLDNLSRELYKRVPSGVGKGGVIDLTPDQMDQVLTLGAAWAVNNGYGLKKDLAHIESQGVLKDADVHEVSDHAKRRGENQLGTIGAGNHFVEVDRVQEIFNEEIAEAFGLRKGQIVVLIHTGSRGLGHQIATDYIRIMVNAMQDYGIKLPDRELACVPLSSPEGQSYYKAMCAAANFAWCNREVITWEIRKAWKNIFGEAGGELELLYDVAHNMAKIEIHRVNGQEKKYIVHRKGATRAFGPHDPDIPQDFRHLGQPVLIPGSMGTASYVLAGTEKSMKLTFGSTCHGAGRRLSRRAAKRQIKGRQLQDELRERGIYVRAGSSRGVAEEAPAAYKDVNTVVQTVHLAEIATKVAKLNPLAVVKG